MPKFGHYDAFVEVDGVHLPEYDVVTKEDTPDGVPLVSCWIPSESGKPFLIACENTQRPRGALRCDFTVDGVGPVVRILRADHGPFANTTRSKCSLDFVNTTSDRRTLVFADMELTDDDALLGAAVPAQLGELCVRAQAIVVTSHGPPSKPAAPIELSTGRVHERTKKAGVHSVKLGAVSTQPEPWVVATTNVGPPIADFVFRYRPLALLQAQGIAPLPTPARASPSPVPVPREESPEIQVKDEGGEDVSNEEIRRLQEQIDALKKRKRLNDGAKVKTEPSAQRPRLSNSNEVIDLTLD